MNLAVIGTSRKENEKRVAIHPEHIKNISKNMRRHLFFEKGYGKPFGMSDEKIEVLTGHQLVDRQTMLREFDAILIPKPVEEDFQEMKEGALVWGWVHSVQQSKITQIAIDKKLTLMAWGNMYSKGNRSRTHVFQKNNEMAGYCGVQHAMQLRGIDGNYGMARKAAVLSFGSVSRGAICALLGHGIHDITVFTQRPCHLVADKIPGIQYKCLHKNETGNFEVESPHGKRKLLIDELINADIIVNGILQNPNAPVTFIQDSDVIKFRKECLVIDISCDMEMGFSFAHPTDLAHPFYKQGNILYYSVDHTPTLLWDSASWEISNCILPYLKDFMGQVYNPVLNDAIDIKDGVILNKNILEYQNRSHIYPYVQRNYKNQNEKVS